MTPSTLTGLLHRAVRIATAAASATTLSVSVATPAAMQSAYLVADLGESTPYAYNLFGGPTAQHVSAGGKHYFFNDDGIHGWELWRTDGTPLGTFMIRDLCPGSCGTIGSAFDRFAPLGERLVYSANDGVHGVELWITDGTSLGTSRILDLAPGFASSQIRSLTPAADQVFFVAHGADTRDVLWRTDGTAKGTYPIAPPGTGETFAPSSIHSGPGFLFLCNATWGGQTGLWRSDGSAVGTQFLAPVSCWQNSIGKMSPISVSPSGLLLFHGFEVPTADTELWRSDGTPSGTFRVKDLVPGPSGSSPYHFAWLGNSLVFEADQRLWRSDGTEVGTQVIPLPDDAQIRLQFGSWAVAGSKYYFTAEDPDHGIEPWVFDGHVAQRIADLAPGQASSIVLDRLSFSATLLEPFGDDVLFLANDGVWGREVWRSDGSAGGTTRISDIAPGTEGIRIPVLWSAYPASIGGRLLLPEHRKDTGDRLWRVDPSGTSMELVETLRAQTSLFQPRGTDRYSLFEPVRGAICFEAVGRHLFFDELEPDEDAGFTVNLRRSDGALSEPDEMLHGFLPAWMECAARGDRLLFTKDRETPDPNWELLSIHGETAVLESLIATAEFPTTVPLFASFEDETLFGIAGALLATDGTLAGTQVRASEVEAGWLEPFQDETVIASSSLWITASEEPTGARLLLALQSGEVGVESKPAALGNIFVFVAWDALHGSELWGSDGTAEGTGLIVDSNPGSASLFAGVSLDRYFEVQKPKIVVAGTFAAFAGITAPTGEELWVSDGTALGTHLLQDIYPGEYPSTPRNLTRFGDRVFFTAESELEGLELWATDGTAPGTQIVRDIAPGGASSIPEDLVVRDGTLYFSAWTASHGREAWKSDGTFAGTIRITDIAPGPKSSSPQRFARAGNRLFLSATDQIHGYELWAISDDGSIPLFLDGFESESPFRWSAVEP